MNGLQMPAFSRILSLVFALVVTLVNPEPSAAETILSADCGQMMRDASHLANTPAGSSKRAQLEASLTSAAKTVALTCAVDGVSVLHVVSGANAYGAVGQLLIRGANPNAKTPEGDTALHFAIRADAFWAVDRLLKGSANQNITDGANRSPLQVAAIFDAGSSLKLLVSHGASVGKTLGERKLTLAHLAAANNSVSAIASLAEVGADLSIPDSKGYSAVDYATVLEMREAIEALTRRGARHTASPEALASELASRKTLMEVNAVLPADVKKLSVEQQHVASWMLALVLNKLDQKTSVQSYFLAIEARNETFGAEAGVFASALDLTDKALFLRQPQIALVAYGAMHAAAPNAAERIAQRFGLDGSGLDKVKDAENLLGAADLTGERGQELESYTLARFALGAQAARAGIAWQAPADGDGATLSPALKRQMNRWSEVAEGGGSFTALTEADRSNLRDKAINGMVVAGVGGFAALAGVPLSAANPIAGGVVIGAGIATTIVGMRESASAISDILHKSDSAPDSRETGTPQSSGTPQSPSGGTQPAPPSTTPSTEAQKQPDPPKTQESKKENAPKDDKPITTQDCGLKGCGGAGMVTPDYGGPGCAICGKALGQRLLDESTRMSYGTLKGIEQSSTRWLIQLQDRAQILNNGSVRIGH